VSMAVYSPLEWSRVNRLPSESASESLGDGSTYDASHI
jgi:hypothetical protein